MALMDKLTLDGNGNIMIPSHGFSSIMCLLCGGVITRDHAIGSLNLEQSDEAQLDQIMLHYSGLTDSEKIAFHCKVEALTIAVQSGFITDSQYKTELGIT